MTQSYIQEGKKEEGNQEGNATVPVAGTEPMKFEPLGGSKKADAKQDPKQPLADRKPTFDNMRKVWEAYWRNFVPGPVDGLAIGPKTRGRWSQFRSECEAEGVNPMHMIASGIENWSHFRSYVQKRQGRKLGITPNCWEIMSHLSCAVDLATPTPLLPLPIPPKGTTVAEMMQTQKVKPKDDWEGIQVGSEPWTTPWPKP